MKLITLTVPIHGLFALLTLPLFAQTKVSDRASLAAAALDPAVDILGIVDISAGAAGSKKITINNLFSGWGFTTAGMALATGASATAQRTALGLGSAATAAASSFEQALGSPSANGFLLSSTTAGVRTWIAPPTAGAGDMLRANNLSDLVSFPTARTNLGLVIGSNVQAWDADLDSWASKTAPSGTVVGTSDTQTLTGKTLTSPVINVTSDATGDLYYRSAGGAFSRLGIGAAGQFLKVTSGLPAWATVPGGGDLLSANNLSDLADAATARTNLGLVIGTNVQAWDADLNYLATFTPSANVKSILNAADYAAVRTLAGVVIGSNVQAWDADLDTWATKTAPSGTVVGTSDTQTLTGKTLTSPTINLTSDATGDIYFRSAGGAFTRLGVGATGQVLTVASGLPSWAAGGGGGSLTNFTEAVNSAAPNATVPAVSLTGTNAATNVDLAIVPKGTGAITGQIPDATSTSGNKRGSLSVDFQRARSTAVQVASGSKSVVSGGTNNTASGLSSVVAGGETCIASGELSSVSGGQGCTASGACAAVLGGQYCVASGNFSVAANYASTASGANSFAAGSSTTAGGDGSFTTGYGGTALGAKSVSCGTTNVVTGSDSCAFGQSNSIASGADKSSAFGISNTIGSSFSHAVGYLNKNPAGGNASFTAGFSNTANATYSFSTGKNANTKSVFAAAVRCAGSFDNDDTGSAQTGKYIARGTTANSTPTQIFLDGASEKLTISANSTYSFQGQISARSSTGDSAAWRFSGTIERGATAATTAIIGTVLKTDTNSESGASAWAISVDADTTNGSLRLQVTGAASTAIRWVATVDTCEVTY